MQIAYFPNAAESYRIVYLAQNNNRTLMTCYTDGKSIKTPTNLESDNDLFMETKKIKGYVGIIENNLSRTKYSPCGVFGSEKELNNFCIDSNSVLKKIIEVEIDE